MLYLHVHGLGSRELRGTHIFQHSYAHSCLISANQSVFVTMFALLQSHNQTDATCHLLKCGLWLCVVVPTQSQWGRVPREKYISAGTVSESCDKVKAGQGEAFAWGSSGPNWGLVVLWPGQGFRMRTSYFSNVTDGKQVFKCALLAMY